MPQQIKISNNLPHHNNNQIKIKIQYNKIIDDISESIIYSTDLVDMNENSFNIDMDKKICNIESMNVYLVYKNMAYLFKFILDDNTEHLTINITMGEIYPIVRINNNKAIRRDEMYIWSPFNFCTCGSITMALDSIEKTENNEESMCVIL